MGGGEGYEVQKGLGPFTFKDQYTLIEQSNTQIALIEQSCTQNNQMVKFNQNLILEGWFFVERHAPSL